MTDSFLHYASGAVEARIRGVLCRFTVKQGRLYGWTEAQADRTVMAEGVETFDILFVNHYMVELRLDLCRTLQVGGKAGAQVRNNDWRHGGSDMKDDSRLSNWTTCWAPVDEPGFRGIAEVAPLWYVLALRRNDVPYFTNPPEWALQPCPADVK